MRRREFKNKADKLGYNFGEICVILSFVVLGIGLFSAIAEAWADFFKLTILWFVLYCYGNWRTGGDMEI